MPNSHFNVKIITRAAGQSAVAAASYRSGEMLYDERASKLFDYTRKEDVLHSEILAPAGSPEWMQRRETLWNGVESAEKRKDAQLARAITAGLPRELTHEQQQELVRRFVEKHCVGQGMIADCCFHESPASDGGKNPHVHIMLTMRDIEGDAFGKKNRDWNQKERLEGWRDAWETLTNEALAAADSDAQVSLKSFEKEGIDRVPEVHLGHEADRMERMGVETARGNVNRAIRHDNVMRDALNGRQRRSVSRPSANPGQPAPENPEALHRSTLRALLQDQSSGMSREQVEQIARFSRYLWDTSQMIGKAVMERFTRWTSRVSERNKDRAYER